MHFSSLWVIYSCWNLKELPSEKALVVIFYLVSDNHSLYLELENNYTKLLMISNPQRTDHKVPGNSIKIKLTITEWSMTLSNPKSEDDGESFITDNYQETTDAWEPTQCSPVGHISQGKYGLQREGIKKCHPKPNPYRRREKCRFLSSSKGWNTMATKRNSTKLEEGWTDMLFFWDQW